MKIRATFGGESGPIDVPALIESLRTTGRGVISFDPPKSFLHLSHVLQHVCDEFPEHTVMASPGEHGEMVLTLKDREPEPEVWENLDTEAIQDTLRQALNVDFDFNPNRRCDLCAKTYSDACAAECKGYIPRRGAE